MRPDGSTIWLAGQGRAAALSGGERVLMGVNFETTELHAAVERSAMVAGEMAHRIKNLLSLVSSMFSMAARSATDIESLVDAFNGRLTALARLNELIFSGDREVVELRALVGAVLAPVIGDTRIMHDVPDVALNATAAQTLTLTLNELMTNAVKYGALSDPGGKVRLEVALDDGFVLTWTETTPGGIAKPEKTSGFGMRVLTGMTAATFGGVPSVEWRDDGMRFTCRWGLHEMAG